MSAVTSPVRLPAYASPGPPPAEVDFRLAQDAIRLGLYTDAHLLLLALARHDPHDPQVWLLLAWTAPSRGAAIAYFKRMQRLAPDSPLAQDGLLWSQHEWSPLRHPAAPSAASPGRTASPPASARRWHLSFPARLALYLLGIAVAETVTALIHPQLGLVLHGALLALIILHASLASPPAQQRFLITLALAPLIRLLSLSMPLLPFQFTYWYLIIGAPLFISAFLVGRLTGIGPRQVGLALGKWPLQVLVGLSGVALGWIEYRILKPAPLVESWSLEQVWLPALILLVFTGFLEEYIFRGLMQRAAGAVMARFGLIYVSLLFAVLHIGYRSLADFIFVFCVGLGFSLVAQRTRSIWGVTLAHGLTNITLFLFYPFF